MVLVFNFGFFVHALSFYTLQFFKTILPTKNIERVRRDYERERYAREPA